MFKMITGKVPFKGTTSYEVFPQVLEGTLPWPTDIQIDPDCKDFIQALLQMKSEDRLGCPNTDHDMKKLFGHPFL